MLNNMGFTLLLFYHSRFLVLLFLTSSLAANDPIPFPNATIPLSKSSSMVITSSATVSKPTSETLSCRIDDDGGFCSYPGEASVVEYYPGDNNPYRWWDSSSPLSVAMQASSCSENWVSLFSKYITTASPSLYTNVYDTQTYEIYSDGFRWTASAPCCLECSFTGAEVQVYYWPTAAPSPAASTLVNSENFTFVSPSIYVAFKSIYAWDLCGTLGSKSLATLSFPPDYLSVATGWHMVYNTGPDGQLAPAQSFFEGVNTDFSLATWGQEACTDIYTTLTQLVQMDPEAEDPPATMLWTYFYNSCSKMLSAPPELYTLLSISPVTTLCLEPIYGFYDPPYALSAANGLFAPVTAAPPDPVDTGKGGPTTPTSAAAGQIPNPSTATKTTPLTLTPTPVYIPPNSQTNDPPQDPPTNVAAPTQPSAVGNGPPPSQVPSSVSQDPPLKNAPPSQITLAGSTFTANSESAFVVGTQTLSVNGQAITISGTIFSLAPNNAVVTASPTPSDPISKIVVDDQTLVAGGAAVTISGTVISLISGGNSVVVGGKAEPVSVIAGTGTTVGLGGIIVSIGGFGGKPNEAGGSASTSTSTTSTIGFNALVFTGDASKGDGNIWFTVALNFCLSITLLWMH